MANTFEPLTCTCCGRGGMIHVASRFPSVRLCWDCIKKAQRVLYQIHGGVPRIDWLVVGDYHWLYESNAATAYPYPRST